MTLVFVETDEAGQVALTSAEAVTFARTNAETLATLATSLPAGQPSGRSATQGNVAQRPEGGSDESLKVEAAVIGPLTGAATEQLARLGVETIHHLEHPDLEAYSAAAWAQALVDIAPEAGTAMASGTPRGMELMAHVAVRTGQRMAANVVAADAEGLLRQVLGGAAFERLQLDGDLQVLTIAGHACNPEETTPTSPEVLDYELDVAEEDLRTRVLRTEVETADDTSGLTQARAVVGAGRGVGSENGFGEVLELVDHLSGALGVSRVVTGLGWRPHSEQVGQTGSRITPDVYIACGISGAIQHMAGIEGAKTLVAINTDAESTMVQRSDYAIIGDLHEVVGAVNEEIRSRRG
ncbi:MAG: electron transfer flavoprotein subunit alpha/FixB family protein [Brevibacterium sp.]|uniref:electron transfer flavoprotein subunit alpha/FixB family protein n=1 Tax=Brevibacterium sp. TaxID=1701 RepID=UPI0026473B90|nr:electron transfer flavoprotein subunit alpha/FixB family protein [Brevibacterium sp.]MDN5807283.1 electron transfer flavoprotein subunit alpha/FixB family protein [Brevibacterium sp.]MDN5834206.1 electron transfer flavoprotein subunit alpha/FixB family protein [Brevibacterium sp.]MDN5877116.1 electron transfer flavoprotein subunit alpha/FixB family protein [Brevibacterium sp.]MDN5910055.1 electron transfer flavoprotein subunit alpha/FixB family protein [Brevibacterium sp.]MDN6122678.1 elect